MGANQGEQLLAEANTISGGPHKHSAQAQLGPHSYIPASVRLSYGRALAEVFLCPLRMSRVALERV